MRLGIVVVKHQYCWALNHSICVSNKSEVTYKRLDKQITKQEPNQGGCQQCMTVCFLSLYSDSANAGGNVIVLWQFSKAMKISASAAINNHSSLLSHII